MEFTHGGSQNRLYTDEEVEEDDDRDERSCARGTEDIGIHHFFPITSSAPSSSSAIALNWISPLEPSTSSAPSPSTTAVEHMFEKVVTPSDVGKLNRLVIPKQHAEKYFPLDASTHDSGLLLNFEDSNGKPWRFRYSYWNSSQSYVMTKGWSRFVKEKSLYAGDTISFGRGMGETASHRLFIDWKRRPYPYLNPQNTLRIHRFPYQRFTPSPSSAAHPHRYLSFARSASAPWAASRLFVPHGNPPSASALAAHPTNPSFPAFVPPVPTVLDSIPVIESKRVRLFGVNLEESHEAGDSATTASFLGPQLRPPFPSQDLRLGSNDPFSASSFSSSAKATDHSPPFDLDVL